MPFFSCMIWFPSPCPVQCCLASTVRAEYIPCTQMGPSGESFHTWVWNSRDYQVCQTSCGLLEVTDKSMCMFMALTSPYASKRKCMRTKWVRQGEGKEEEYLLSCIEISSKYFPFKFTHQFCYYSFSCSSFSIAKKKKKIHVNNNYQPKLSWTPTEMESNWRFCSPSPANRPLSMVKQRWNPK